jgi:ribonuclease D
VTQNGGFIIKSVSCDSLLKAMDDQINGDLNPPRSKNSENQNLLKELKNLLCEINAKLNIPPEIIANRQDLKDFWLDKENIRFLSG